MTTFRINRVYTRSGDGGDTGLVGGGRVSKASLQVESYGEVDELNSYLGAVKEELPRKLAELAPLIEYIQQELFDLGAELATKSGETYEGMWHAEALHIKTLEDLCDRYGDKLPELTSFIRPGGSKTCAALHVARTVARRAERAVVRYRDELHAAGLPELNPHTMEYLNRLSDLLFVLARWSLDQEGKTAPLWVPARERKV